jgi:riboflavin synthase
MGEGKELTVSVGPDFLEGVKLGDSIAVNGACQTVTALGKNDFTFYSSRETLSLTNLALLAPKALVNLEKALTLGKGIDGHLVSGHVDGMGTVVRVSKQQAGYLLCVSLPEGVLDTVVEKGSIAVDGISLTIFSLKGNEVTVSVIPFTYLHTTLKDRKNNDPVNIETDMLGKYVVHFLKRQQDKGGVKKGITLDLLQEKGFFS